MESNEYVNRETETPESTEARSGPGIAYTPTISALRSQFGDEPAVASAELAQALARSHPEYAGGQFETLARESFTGEGFTEKPADAWFREVEQLFDPGKVTELHGRLFALGLCELDSKLKGLFDKLGLLSALHGELKENFGSLLNRLDPAKLHLDSDSHEDHLGRDGFVEALAMWLNRFWQESNPKDVKEDDRGKGNSFMVHLHGPWGSGKSTLLNLLEQKLTRRDRIKKQEGNDASKQSRGREEDSGLNWVVIRFNAWQHSHVEPAWWPMLNQLYKESRKNLKEMKLPGKARSIWWYDFYWKLVSGNKSTGYWFALFAVLLVLVSIPEIDEALKSYIQIATLAGTVVTGASYFFRSLIWGSAGSARDYLRLNQDPLERIKEYFRGIVGRAGQPVMIYIDDLDRCPSSYVVDLLESLQTLFNDSRVFYVLAADRRWLYGSFEERYGEFRKHIEEPGKQIGFLFLDKLFQLSISVPQVSAQVRENYLNYLYLGKKYGREKLEKYRRDARKEFERFASDSELIDKAVAYSGDSTRDQVRREEAVRASAKAEIEASTEYFLRQFAHLLEPNPRSIKRLVNNYGIYRAIVMLSDLSVIDTEEKRKKFALWNIVAMRWPLLAEYLDEERSQLPLVLKGNVEQIGHDKIKELAAIPELQNVLQGKGVDTSLDAEYVEKVLNLQAAPA